MLEQQEKIQILSRLTFLTINDGRREKLSFA